MNYIPQILIDLAKAFEDGDNSALAPLHDFLCENGWEPMATYIRMYYEIGGYRSAFVRDLAKGEDIFIERNREAIVEDCKPENWLGRRYAEVQKMGSKAAKNT